MTKIDVYSGFLGAGKTTLIKKMIQEVYAGQKIVLIENEFGEIGIDGDFLQDAGVQIREMNSGCICCSLVGDFGKALHQVIDEYHPERILIEPSGVGKLSDVLGAVSKVTNDEVKIGYTVAVSDASKVKKYARNFGEFYNNQIETASVIILSRSAEISEEKLQDAIGFLREHNPNAVIITTPWKELTGAQLAEAFEGQASVASDLADLAAAHVHEHEHCHHDHEHEHEHEHCHHEHDEHCCCHEHDHEGHHHADDVFSSWGTETVKNYTEGELKEALEKLDGGDLGAILRAKGVVSGTDGTWLHFDYVPGDWNVRTGSPAITGKLCVIGSQLKEDGIAAAFGI